MATQAPKDDHHDEGEPSPKLCHEGLCESSKDKDSENEIIFMDEKRSRIFK